MTPTRALEVCEMVTAEYMPAALHVRGFEWVKDPDDGSHVWSQHEGWDGWYAVCRTDRYVDQRPPEAARLHTRVDVLAYTLCKEADDTGVMERVKCEIDAVVVDTLQWLEAHGLS